MNISHLLTLLLVVIVANLPHLHAERYDYPTANLSTIWTNGPQIPHTIDYPEGSLIKALLLHSPIERYGPTFAGGFYCRSRTTTCNDFIFAVFIIYTNSGAGITMATLGVPQVVWSANRNRPVKENATLRFTPDGNLVLKDADGSFVWSTNTAGKQVATMTITDTGNLALLDKRGAIVWQSFDHPTDVLLPGQKLLDGQSLTSNISSWNWRDGLYYLTATSTNFNAYVNPGPGQKYYYYGAPERRNQRTTNYMQLRNGSLGFFPGSSSNPTSSVALPPATSQQYMRLESDGHLKVYQWMPSGGWMVVADVMRFYPLPGDCAYPTACGSFGICSKNMQCSCPRDKNNRMVNYFLPVEDVRPELGCEPVIPISCRASKYHTLLQLDDISFNYYDESFKQPNLKSIGSCKEACLRSCSCRAAFFRYGGDDKHGSCFLVPQVLSLIDHERELMHYNSTAFIKVQVVY